MSRNTLRIALLAAVLGISGGLAGCKEDSGMEKAKDNVGDAFDARDNEKMKDAGENAKDAVKDAGDAVEEKAEEVKEDVKD